MWVIVLWIYNYKHDLMKVIEIKIKTNYVECQARVLYYTSEQTVRSKKKILHNDFSIYQKKILRCIHHKLNLKLTHR